MQDTCGVVSGVAEAATLCWLVTGEEKYFAKARDFLLQACSWRFAPDWKSGPVVGATDITCNDEAHFRLWRKLPLVYDQLRARLSPEEKAKILAHFTIRGRRSAEWITREGDIANVRRNSLDADPPSHPVRFMPMTGLTALALWDDLPEAREWWRLAYVFYRDQFSPWGGDDGGWAEGSAYWRGTFEHATFQDMLLALGDPLAYASPFWKNSPLFCLYNVQPYLHTTFGDASNAGRFNLEPVIADYMEHLARVQQNGFFLAYAGLCTDQRTRPIDRGLNGLDRTYPTAAEFLVRNFIASGKPLPPIRSLDELPPHRYFSDVGWVSLHSALGWPDDDIHLTFKSSPYGSFSHSHADQNSFILNAYGEGLAINSAYQLAQSDRARVQRVTRDLVFIDARYVVLRDRVELATPGRLTWLLHAEKDLTWDDATTTAIIRGQKATLTTRLIAPGVSWQGRVTHQFPVPVDPKYARGEVTGAYLTGSWHDHQHLTVESTTAATEFTVYSVLWPERGPNPVAISARLNSGALTIIRPDGKTDTLTLTDDTIALR